MTHDSFFCQDFTSHVKKSLVFQISISVFWRENSNASEVNIFIFACLVKLFKGLSDSFLNGFPKSSFQLNSFCHFCLDTLQLKGFRFQFSSKHENVYLSYIFFFAIPTLVVFLVPKKIHFVKRYFFFTIFNCPLLQDLL